MYNNVVDLDPTKSRCGKPIHKFGSFKEQVQKNAFWLALQASFDNDEMRHRLPSADIVEFSAQN